MSFFPSTVIGYIVLEKETNVKHQQLVSGVNVVIYYLAFFFFDAVSFALPIICATILVYIFDITQFLGTAVPYYVLVYVGYGCSSVAFSYALSFFFKKHTTAQNVMLFFTFISGLVLMIASFVMGQLESTRDINSKLIFVYRLFPGFAFGDALLNMASIFVVKGIPIYGPDISKGGIPRIAHPSDDFITGYDLIYLFSSAVVFLLYAVFKEVQLSFCPSARSASLAKFEEGMEEEEDDDVRAERDRISGGNSEDVVIVDGLRKAYGKKLAVKGVSYGVQRGQCFSLLGVNGAGKTTTFKMLTGDIAPTYGSALIGGYSVRTSMNKARQLIGYCPQFGGLLRLLTVREHLELYANVKGIPAASSARSGRGKDRPARFARIRKCTRERFERG